MERYRDVRSRLLLAVCGGLIALALLTFGASGMANAQIGTIVPTFGAVGGEQPTLAPTQTPTAQPTVPPAPEATIEPTIPPLPTLRSDMMGIQVYSYLTISDWWGIVDRAQFMGFKWIKVQISWKEFEPEGPGQASEKVGILKDHMIYAGRRGFKLLLSFANAPDWARPAAARGQADGPAANPEDYAGFIERVLRDWGLEYIGAIEIWNEPNLQREWTGAPLSAQSYKAHFDAAYRRIRTISPTVTILTAGLAPSGDTSGSIDDRRFIDTLYKLGLPITDQNFAIGAHPYGWANAPDERCCKPEAERKGWDDQKYFFFLDTVLDYRQLMNTHNHPFGKIWITEFGYPSWEGLHFQDHIKGPTAMPPNDPGLAWMLRLNQTEQAQYVIRTFELAQNGELAQFLGPSFLWNMNFSTLPTFIYADQPSRQEAGFSVLDNDWATRPIYRWLQAAPKQ